MVERPKLSRLILLLLLLGLRDNIRDIVSGLVSRLERRYSIGDQIELRPSRILGVVEGVSWRSAYLRDAESHLVSIPHGVVGRSIVINHSTPTRSPRHQRDDELPAALFDLLQQVELFKTLDREELERLGQDAHARGCHAGETIVRQGEPGDSMYILREGHLQVQVTMPSSEKPVPVGTIRPGEFFGEMSLLTGEQRSATVSATTLSLVIEITKDHVHELFETRPRIAEAISIVAAQRQLQLNDVYRTATRAEQQAQQTEVAREILTGVKSFFNLTIDVDEQRLQRDVSAITDTDYFRSLSEEADRIRRQKQSHA